MPDNPDMLDPKSPCTATITPGKKGGMTVELFVPTYSGGVTFSLMSERSNDGDWRVFLPWYEGMDEDRVYINVDTDSEVAGGIAYIGAPDVVVARREA